MTDVEFEQWFKAEWTMATQVLKDKISKNNVHKREKVSQSETKRDKVG